MIKLMVPSNLVFPDFQNSIVNLGATMAQFLGQKPQHTILPTLSAKLDAKIKNIVYLVIDGMGTKILEKNLPADSFLRKNQIQTVTSVFPATTAAATTALISGLTSAQHGWFAWATDFDGAVVELFRNRNYYTEELLTNPNFILKQLPYQTIWENTNTKRDTYTCFPKNCYQNPAKNQLVYQSLRQMLRQLHKICSQSNQKFIYDYYPDLDTMMHQYGTTARKPRRLLQKLNRKIAHLVRRAPNTLFVITADHGQTDVKGYDFFCDDTTLQNCLAHPISWDGRAACFKVKPGYDAQFKDAFQKYAQDYTLFKAEDVIKQGLCGNFSQKPDYRKFLGDYLAVGNTSGHIGVLKKPSSPKKLYRGTHSGMTPDEMYVPVIVAGGE